MSSSRQLTGGILLNVSVAAALGCAPAASPPPSPPAVEVPAAAASAPAAVEREQVAAEAGVAKQGRSLDNEKSIIAQPARAYFAVKERMVFEVQIPQALSLYKATNGEGPKSHDEFMAQIVQANNIPLPKLPEGHVYVYDPATGELMVDRPKQ